MRFGKETVFYVEKINIAVVGLGFGAEFIPIWQRDPKKLKAISDALGVEKRYADFQDLLKDPNVDAVHINSPIPDQSWMSIAALKAGKHVACTVRSCRSIRSRNSSKRLILLDCSPNQSSGSPPKASMIWPKRPI
jgi:hypothetical protein